VLASPNDLRVAIVFVASERKANSLRYLDTTTRNMANPRQRRKARSSTQKLTQSKAAKKSKKKVTVQGHPQLVKDWDRTKTVRQK
jgi:hypothetical protein